MKIFIIATGWNCQGLVRKCYDSIISQKGCDFRAVIISDGSTDRTGSEVIHLPYNQKVNLIATPENYGASYHRFWQIANSNLNKEDAICFLGLDDYLLQGALARIKQEYEKGKLMTYGNWMSQAHSRCPVDLYFDEETHRTRSYRQVEYRSTAPNTFSSQIADRLTLDDFQVDGKFLHTCTEGGVMFSALEMAGKDRIGVIEEPIYFYLESRPGGSLHKYGRAHKLEILQKIRQKQKRDLI